jgi:hypothetical protein
MLPRYPTFKVLEWEDRPCVEAFTRRHAPYSDWVFSGLLTWNPRCRIALLNDNLVIWIQDYGGDTEFFSFFGTTRVVETAKTLLNDARHLGLLSALCLIPEFVIGDAESWPPSLQVEPDRDNDDYILSLRACVELPGRDFREHRKKIGACRRLGRIDFRPMCLKSPTDQDEILSLFDAWAGRKTGDARTEVNRERAALCSLLTHLGSDERIMASGLYDDAMLVGLSICEEVPESPCVVHHFMKTDLRYNGLASYLMHLTSRCLLERGYTLANIEQDLGIPGLRANKLSWRPCHVLRKFTITATT